MSKTTSPPLAAHTTAVTPAPWRASELQCAEAAVHALTPSPGRGPQTSETLAAVI